MSLPDGGAIRRISSHLDPYAQADIYYGDLSSVSRKDPKNRAFSAVVEPGSHPLLDGWAANNRRSSLDAQPGQRKFLIPVEATLKNLLSREDTDNNSQITIEDSGPKVSYSFCLRHAFR